MGRTSWQTPAANPVVPDGAALIQFVLVAGIACIVVAGARFILTRRRTPSAGPTAQSDSQRVKRARRFRARVWAGVGGSMTGYAGVMLAGPIALGDGVQPLWVALLVVGVGCVAWSSHLRRQHSSPTA